MREQPDENELTRRLRVIEAYVLQIVDTINGLHALQATTADVIAEAVDALDAAVEQRLSVKRAQDVLEVCRRAETHLHVSARALREFEGALREQFSSAQEH